MVYYNQNNYPNSLYPSSSNPKATIKSGGCGVTCAAMIVSNLVRTVDPVTMAAYAISKGARNSGGTDMNILAKAISADYGLTYTTATDENVLLSHLKAGKMAVCNVGGDKSGYVGVFSDGGHFIVAAGINSAGKVLIMDPGYYAGKFNKTGRAGKVSVSGNYCICDISVLAADTSNRSPAYWLFSVAAKTNQATYPAINITTGGKTFQGVNISGTSYAPVRTLAENLGYAVQWDAATNTVLIATSIKPVATTTVKINIGNHTIAAKMINGSTYAPVRELAELLGKTVGWNQATNTVTIN